MPLSESTGVKGWPSIWVTRSPLRRPAVSAAPPTLGEPQGFPGSLRAGPAVNHLHVYSSSAVSLELRVDGRPVAANESYGEQTFLSLYRGDKKVDYGTVMRVMGRLSQAGFRRVALVTEVEQG